MSIQKQTSRTQLELWADMRACHEPELDSLNARNQSDYSERTYLGIRFHIYVIKVRKQFLKNSLQSNHGGPPSSRFLTGNSSCASHLGGHDVLTLNTLTAFLAT